MTLLSPAERRILELSKRGYTDEELARDYHVSVQRIRDIKAAAKSKAVQNTGGEYWNR